MGKVPEDFEMEDIEPLEESWNPEAQASANKNPGMDTLEEE